MTMCMTCGGRQAPARGDVPCRCGRFAKPIYDRGHRDGFDAAARLFWQGVCEQMARPLGEEASEREGYARGWRALLERDVAEVERALDWLETLGRGADAIAGGYAAMRMWEQRAVDCRAWLARARAVLS